MVALNENNKPVEKIGLRLYRLHKLFAYIIYL